MFIGPVFTREAITAPRRPGFFVARALLVASLLGLAFTAWQVTVGTGSLEGPSELSRFGSQVFGLLAPLVLTLGVLFSALLAAAAVSQEKSRGTLILLLLTDLRNSELVLGRMLSSLLTVLVSAVAAVPFFCAIALLGGVDFVQIGRVMGVTLAASLAAGSLGSMLALWREKTFQALALTSLGLVLWLAAGEAAAVLGPDHSLAQTISPWRALAAASQPALPSFEYDLSAPEEQDSLAVSPSDPAARFILFALGLAFALNVFAISMIRIWNPSREARPASPEVQEQEHAHAQAVTGEADAKPVVGRARGQELAVHSAGGKRREVWDNPVLWREIRTWAYGRRVLVVKAAYLVIFALCAMATVQSINETKGAARHVLPTGAASVAPLLVVSLVLVNALSVTSLTGERDGKSLDLLLASELSPSELIFGKLGGAFWNSREMILLPIALFGYLTWIGALTPWLFGLLVLGLLVMDLFSAVLGLHAAMIYASSRRAIGVSVGTLLFLFLGVTTCMRIMLALSNSFENQFVAFLGFIAGGGLALFVALGWRNPSSAMFMASFLAPFATFYAIVSFLIGSYSLVALATTATFGFATAAMLIPALAEFDIATGSTPRQE